MHGVPIANLATRQGVNTAVAQRLQQFDFPAHVAQVDDLRHVGRRRLQALTALQFR